MEYGSKFDYLEWVRTGIVSNVELRRQRFMVGYRDSERFWLVFGRVKILTY